MSRSTACNTSQAPRATQLPNGSQRTEGARDSRALFARPPRQPQDGAQCASWAAQDATHSANIRPDHRQPTDRPPKATRQISPQIRSWELPDRDAP
ncbi:hypothetical protein FJTKL_12005 [Diaporthe vaccinii]|uniref:Uncharacterized protein n=1 Tax=Diaporthe vaccinii TaxID=105482 RepID=A0ABR4FAU9_9PEZI